MHKSIYYYYCCVVVLVSTTWAKTFPTAQQMKLLNEHNAYRSTLLDPKYPAANMMKLEWNTEIETSADQWAQHLALTKNCQMEHPKGKYEYGQNLAIQSGYSYKSPKEELDGMIDVAMKGWGKDEQDLLIPRCEQEGLASQEEFCQGLSTFDHYTQMVWAKTSQIGCAYAFCGSFRLTVCEYGPAGNMAMNNVRQEWYLKGNACSQCPSGTTCDASGKLCVPAKDSSKDFSKAKGSKEKNVSKTPKVTRLRQAVVTPEPIHDLCE